MKGFRLLHLTSPFPRLILARCGPQVGQPFDSAGFDALQKAGKPILVLVHADWCPTCRAQAPVISDLLKEPRFSRIAALSVGSGIEPRTKHLSPRLARR